ncbi:MAG TPA: hypothetical protein VGP88_01570 [Thermoplasmata archaeon]|jgi:hypothetical protein|nr:hypothetical protein [Thermoplasmata archaeon]
MRGGWLVPASAAIAAVVGSFLGITITLAVTPSATVGFGAGGTSPGLDLRFVALFFGAPLAAAAAASASFVGLRIGSPRAGAVAGTLLGIAAAAVVGAETARIGTWWLNSLPTDSNQTSALLCFLVALMGTVAVALSLEAVRDSPGAGGRARWAGLASLTALTGFFLGAFSGGLAGGLTILGGPCTGYSTACSSLAVSSAIESGSLTGGWIGALTGVGVATVVWAATQGRRSGTPVAAGNGPAGP